MLTNLSMTVLCGCEFLLTTALCMIFWKKGLHRRFRMTANYFLLRAISVPVMLLLLAGYLQAGIKICYGVYFFVYWAVYISSAVLLFFVCIEVFRSALSSFVGLAKLGIVVFRWAVVLSLIFTFSTVSFGHLGIMTIPEVGSRLMRAASILELCLLAFLCLCMNTLKLSVRDMAFGVSLGLGVMAMSDFVQATAFASYAKLTAPLQFCCELLTLIVLATWMMYALLPEKERKPVLIAASSPIYRWNEIASALGHTGTKVAVQQPANSFFLTDVEKVVERVVARNLKGRESET
jgi:hypothetical protein